MSLLDGILNRVGYYRYNDGSHFYTIKKNNPTTINGTDKLEFSLANPVIQACIEIRAKILSQVEFFIDGKESDPLLDLLNNPNPLQSKQDFLKQFEWLKSTYGWVYQKPYGPSGFKADNIFNLRSSCIEFPKTMKSSIVWEKSDVDAYYEQKIIFKEPDQETRSFELKEIIPYYDLSNGLTKAANSSITSPSRLDSIIKQANNITLASDAENVMIQTNGREIFFGGTTKGTTVAAIPMDNYDKNNIERKLMNNYGLGFGRRRSIATKNEVGYKSLHIPLKDLGLHDSIVNNANIVREAYEVPNELYTAFMKGATFENQKEALIGFIQNTIQPIADDIANSWTSYFGYEKTPIQASFSHLPVMQHTEEKKADKLLKIATAYEKLTRAGLGIEAINNLFTSQGIDIENETN